MRSRSRRMPRKSRGGAAPTATLTDYMWLIEEDPHVPYDPGGHAAERSRRQPGADHQQQLPHQSYADRRRGLHGSLVLRRCASVRRRGRDAQAALAAVRRRSRSDEALFHSALPGDAGNAFIAAIGGDPTIPGNGTFRQATAPLGGDGLRRHHRRRANRDACTPVRPPAPTCAARCAGHGACRSESAEARRVVDHRVRGQQLDERRRR